jgi:peptidyl-lysine (3S)-dioxygenase / protease
MTALHKDNYENIYAQIVGKKYLNLLPPIEAACVNERQLPVATVQAIRCTCCESEDNLTCPRGKEDHDSHGDYAIVTLDEPRQTIPFPTWDPEPQPRHEDSQPSPHSHLARPMRVRLDEGDMLYLPALWYHSVSQTSNPDKGGINVSVNYWYDMDFDGHLWSSSQFIRSNSAAAGMAQADGGSAASDVGEDYPIGPLYAPRVGRNAKR